MNNIITRMSPLNWLCSLFVIAMLADTIICYVFYGSGQPESHLVAITILTAIGFAALFFQECFRKRRAKKLVTYAIGIVVLMAYIAIIHRLQSH